MWVVGRYVGWQPHIICIHGLVVYMHSHLDCVAQVVSAQVAHQSPMKQYCFLFQIHGRTYCQKPHMQRNWDTKKHKLMMIRLKRSHKQDFGGYVRMFFYFKKRSSQSVLFLMDTREPPPDSPVEVVYELPIQESGHLNLNEGLPNDSQADGRQ